MEWGLEWIFDFVEFSLIFYFVEFSFQALPIRLVGNRVIPQIDRGCIQST